MRKGISIIMVLLVGSMLPGCFLMDSDAPIPCGDRVYLGHDHDDLPGWVDKLNDRFSPCEDQVCNKAVTLVDECADVGGLSLSDLDLIDLNIVCIAINEILDIFDKYIEMPVPDVILEIGTCQDPGQDGERHQPRNRTIEIAPRGNFVVVIPMKQTIEIARFYRQGDTQRGQTWWSVLCTNIN